MEIEEQQKRTVVKFNLIFDENDNNFQGMNKQSKFLKIKRKHCLRVFKANRINQSTKGEFLL